MRARKTPGPRPWHKGYAFRRHAVAQLGVDTLEVKVGNPPVVACHQGYGITLAVDVMTSVQAQRNEFGIGVVKELDLVLVFHVSLGVGMIYRTQAILFERHPRHALDGVNEALPAVGVESAGLRRLAGEEICVSIANQQQERTAHPATPVPHLHLGFDGGPQGGVLKMVHHEAGGNFQAALHQFRAENSGVKGQITRRAEFDPLVVGLHNLVKKAIPRDLLGMTVGNQTPQLSGAVPNLTSMLICFPRKDRAGDRLNLKLDARPCRRR